ncbi:M20 family metallopeptidase [Brevibacterium ravenspurgense]|uniref:M20 metallopeptidase family protein n=1 Tax=Brevibacterium ravenspurgense TaxID=479117 RepID=UPI000780B950|nr:M20 family metallopeptidase [Brevibacterium ravenspurgense]MCG7300605.1 M20 family metallopeptidase [Brevibacterium ravenspurgense]
MDFLQEAQELQPDLQRIRRTLHAHPEVGLDLPETQRRVLEELDGLPLEISVGERTTSVVAVLRGTHENRSDSSPVVLLRGDMDGLPIEELSGEEFASVNGAMHACGHDLHTAGLIGAARLLCEHRDQLAGDVVFMFQPGEEGYGGARVMIEEGIINAAGRPAAHAYGIHVNTDPKGLLRTRPGALQASSNSLFVTVVGEGGHGSQPHEAHDPVPALAEIVTALNTMVTRRLNVFDPLVMSITMLQGGSAINIIPEKVSLGATVRAFSKQALDTFETEANRIARGIADAHGCRTEVTFDRVYPVTVNDPSETEWVLSELAQTFGDDRVNVLEGPIMPSEDFSFVLNEVPGTYIMLGARRPDVPSDQPVADNHSPFVVFDDSVLGDQAAALAHLAAERLKP